MARINRLQLSGLAFGAVLLASVPGTGAHAQKEELDRTPKDCVLLNGIGHARGVDARTILFYMRGDKILRNDLPVTCAVLDPGETQLIYNYKTQSVKLTRLCSYDSFNVKNRPGLQCRLGQFREIAAEEADKLIGKPEEATKDATTDVTAVDPPPATDAAADSPADDRKRPRRRAEDRED